MRNNLTSKTVALGLVTAICIGTFAQTRRPSTSITETVLKAHIKFLADDLLEGRGPGTKGGELAAKYIASQLEVSGLKGAGADGSFFQPVSLLGVKADPST